MSTKQDQPLTQGAHHIGLTVPDLGKTQAFFIDTLGYDKIGEVPDYPAVFLSDGVTMLTLWQAADPDNAIAFDRRNVIGLHHFALSVADHGALDSVYEKLREHPGVDIEFAPEALGGGPARHLMCYIPGGIRVEFISTKEG
jgi:catechol 2,3-dioxygenase-like lactoylglutathione lyase family enzyme